MLVRRRLNATNQVHLVGVPGTKPVPVTDFPEAVGNASYQPTHGAYFVFAQGAGGNEVFRLHRFDLQTREDTVLSPEGERASGFAWNRAGDRIVYAAQMIDRNNPDRQARTAVHIVDPLKPASDRVIAKFDGGSWNSFRFSEDGKRVVFIEFISVNESHLWVMDVATGKRRRVTPPGKGETVSYADPYFSRDGRWLFATSDRGERVPLPGAGPDRRRQGARAHRPHQFRRREPGDLIRRQPHRVRHQREGLPRPAVHRPEDSQGAAAAAARRRPDRRPHGAASPTRSGSTSARRAPRRRLPTT
jgi:dipeptidyl aminopeptidase/acylaminoacyl peptidase